MVVGTLSDRDNSPASRRTFRLRFNSFTTLTSVSDDVFSWGMSTPWTNSSACPNSLSLTYPDARFS